MVVGVAMDASAQGRAKRAVAVAVRMVPVAPPLLRLAPIRSPTVAPGAPGSACLWACSRGARHATAVAAVAAPSSAMTALP